MLRQGLFWGLLLVGLAVGLVQVGSPKTQADNPPAPARSDPQAVDRVVAELHHIGELIVQLDSEQFTTRQKASAELLRLGPPAIEPLKKLLASNPNLELARRADNLLVQIPRDKSKTLTAAELCDRLARTIDLPNGIDANTPFGEALTLLSDKGGVPLVLDRKAFEAIGVQKVEEQPVQLSKMPLVRLDRALSLLLAQVRGDAYQGDFFVRSGHVEITSSYHTMSEVLGGDIGLFSENAGNGAVPAGTPRNNDPPRLMAIVHANVEKRPVQEVLKELTAASGVTIVVDPRVGEKARTPVTALLPNVFLDTAVLVLCDMADVRAVQIDTVFYVTTHENAARLEAQRKPKRIELPKSAGAAPAQG